MKKVDDEKLLEMLSEGIEQKEIAAYFGCAPSFITKRKKQLMATEVVEPETFSTLTDQQKKFCIAKAAGATNIVAAQTAYEVTSPESAKSMGSTLMSNPLIRISIAELMDNHGLTKDNRIKVLKTHVYSRDGNVSLKALDQTWKLDGSYSPEVHVNIDEHHVLMENLQGIERRCIEAGIIVDIKPE